MHHTLLSIGLLSVCAGFARADVGPSFGPRLSFDYSLRLDAPVPGYSVFLMSFLRGGPGNENRLAIAHGESLRLNVPHYRHNRTDLYAAPNQLIEQHGSLLKLLESSRNGLPPGVQAVSLPGIEEIDLFDTRRHTSVEVVVRPGPDGPVFDLVTTRVEQDWSLLIAGGLLSLAMVVLGLRWVRRRTAIKEEDE